MPEAKNSAISEAEQQFDMHDDRDDDHRVEQRAPEVRVAQHLGVVGEADEGRRLPEGGLVQAEPEHVDRRQEDDAADHELDRRNQREGGEDRALLHRSGNPVAREHVAVDLDAEPRPLRHHELPVDELAAFADHADA